MADFLQVFKMSDPEFGSAPHETCYGGYAPTVTGQIWKKLETLSLVYGCLSLLNGLYNVKISKFWQVAKSLIWIQSSPNLAIVDMDIL